MNTDPPVGVCATCKTCFEIAGEVETTAEITIPDLLGDAAQVLRDTGKPALAKVVTVARDLIDAETGETWMGDVLKVLDEAEGVVHAAREGKDTVVLDELARALDECSTWGLNPQHRAQNALREIARSLGFMSAVIASTDDDRAKLEQISDLVERLMKGLGFGTEE
jgi:hypothetical protein